MKTCTICSRDLPVTLYYRDAAARDGRRPQCKDCCRVWQTKNRDKARARQARWRAANLDRAHAMERDFRLRRDYGITSEEFEAMAAAQNGCCAICGKTPQRLVVDHDHQDGHVRGLLCNACNGGIGKLRDDPELLRKALRYLEQSPLAAL